MEFLDDAREELKRVDHMIYVSLKYTRTVDVLLNAINRMIDAYDFIFQAMLQKKIDDKQLESIPITPIEKGNLVRDLYPEDTQIMDNIELFFLLRKLHRSNPQKEQEYRRHVCMTSIIDGREEKVNIDIITQYYHFELDFFKKIARLLEGE